MRLLFCAAAIAACAPFAASAEPYRQPPRVVVIGPQPELIGCYWSKGRHYCSRFCYWEINGKRYCVERLRDAHSQAPQDEIVYGPAPMK